MTTHHGNGKANNLLPATQTAQELAVSTREKFDSQVVATLKLLSGAYGARYQANDAAAAAWAIALHDCGPAEIQRAAIDHIRDTALRDDGSTAGSWPPAPSDILARIHAKRGYKRGVW